MRLEMYSQELGNSQDLIVQNRGQNQMKVLFSNAVMLQNTMGARVQFYCFDY
jgi:hypothetical protein